MYDVTNSTLVVPNSTIIRKDSSLIQLRRYVGDQAGRSLSLLAAKVLAFIISKLDQDATKFTPVEFDVREFWELCGKKHWSGSRYKSLLLDALREISTKSVLVKKKNQAAQKMNMCRFG